MRTSYISIISFHFLIAHFSSFTGQTFYRFSFATATRRCRSPAAAYASTMRSLITLAYLLRFTLLHTVIDIGRNEVTIYTGTPMLSHEY
jgi:hypothetical protein